MAAPYENECPAATGQFVKTLTKCSPDFIAYIQRNTNSDIALGLAPGGWVQPFLCIEGVVMHALSPKTSTSDLEEKRFKTLQAKIALLGLTLHRTDALDGPVTYFVARWDKVLRHLASFEAVQLFYLQIGGRYA